MEKIKLPKLYKDTIYGYSSKKLVEYIANDRSFTLSKDIDKLIKIEIPIIDVNVLDLFDKDNLVKYYWHSRGIMRVVFFETEKDVLLFKLKYGVGYALDVL